MKNKGYPHIRTNEIADDILDSDTFSFLRGAKRILVKVAMEEYHKIELLKLKNNIKLIDSINNEIENCEFKPEYLIKAQMGMNILLAQECIKSGADIVNQSVDFTENSKKYNLDVSIKITEI